MNRVDLQRLSRLRLQEARGLMSLGHYSGSYYLSGYAVECALKACIAKTTLRHDFPDKDRVFESYTHSPAKLLKIAGLDRAFGASTRADSLLASGWNLVLSWSEQSRYEIWTEAQARAIIDAVGRPRHGVLPWIRQHW